MSVNLTVSSAPHIRSNDNTRKIMLDVLIALAPALIAAVWFFGIRALALTVVSAAVCVAAEALLCLVLRKPVTTVFDLSAVVTWPSRSPRAAPTGWLSWATSSPSWW